MKQVHYRTPEIYFKLKSTSYLIFCEVLSTDSRITAATMENSLAAISLVLMLACLATSYKSTKKDMSVTIYNHMTGPLTVRCKSADNHLQQHTHVDRQQYGFAFKPRYWRATIFWCAFSSGTKFLGFPV